MRNIKRGFEKELKRINSRTQDGKRTTAAGKSKKNKRKIMTSVNK